VRVAIFVGVYIVWDQPRLSSLLHCNFLSLFRSCLEKLNYTEWTERSEISPLRLSFQDLKTIEIEPKWLTTSRMVSVFIF
jgi:hypothetical protein